MRIMHNYPQNTIFLYHNLKLHKMINMHLKYDNMRTNRIFNALICINNHINLCMNCMLSTIHQKDLQRLRLNVVDGLFWKCDIISNIRLKSNGSCYVTLDIDAYKLRIHFLPFNLNI